jgi:hypothetical protein
MWQLCGGQESVWPWSGLSLVQFEFIDNYYEILQFINLATCITLIFFFRQWTQQYSMWWDAMIFAISAKWMLQMGFGSMRDEFSVPK